MSQNAEADEKFEAALKEYLEDLDGGEPTWTTFVNIPKCNRALGPESRSLRKEEGDEPKARKGVRD